MASLVLSVAGAAVGGAVFGPAGAIAGRIVGAIGGSLIDRALFSSHTERNVEGPRLADLDVMASTEGAPIPRVYGRARLAGQVIWATRIEEVVSVRPETDESGGGGKGGGPSATVNTTTYTYFANFAVGLCAGPIGRVARIWADGKPLDFDGLTVRTYTGSETQTPDPLIVAREGADNAPAYRGLAYIVFERLPLADFGNRIPQLSFELMRPLGKLEKMVRAVTLIPGTTEFGYERATVVRVFGPGQYAPENRHVAHAVSDVEAAIDDLQAACPNVERVAIVVAWFGNDLRADHCTLTPAVDSAIKQTFPLEWSVAGLSRFGAPVVSTVGGRPAYGGTPSDESVKALIQELLARGIKVTLYPFIVMDIPAGNGLTDPHTGAASQPAYPWRGRITCNPAPGQPGSPDGTAAAATQIAAFFTGYRSMILHYANLAVEAGGINAFVIGSELRGLTRVRSASGVYPAVSHLATLAADVKAIVGSTTIVTYAADWTEYGAHVVDSGASEMRFPLDTLWASSGIDVVGIDYYAPLADWRDGSAHLDRQIADSIYDTNYLAGNLRGGDAYDWFYANDSARAAQTRTPITDGLGKPWVFRVKDIWSWWNNAHVERVGGAELPGPTGWVPQSKPIWLTEVGCPAVDKGANQPSVFPDPKSAESGLPHFSTGKRDDLIQRRMLEAVLQTFDPAHGATLVNNPISIVTGSRMLDPSAIHLWTWDARPYPLFPAATDVWSDGPNWETGHWLTGRLGGAPLVALIGAILNDAGIDGFDTSPLGEGPDGYVIDRPMSPRGAIEPLALAYAFEASEDGATIRFRPRGSEPAADLTEDDLVLPEDAAALRLTRAQETELPREVSIAFTDAELDYRRSAVSSRRLVGGAARAAHADLSVVTNDAAMERRAEIWLQDLWAGRETAEFALPPSALKLTPGDVIRLDAGGRERVLELRETVDTEQRRVRARAIDVDVFALPPATPRRPPPPLPVPVGPVHALVLELPALPGDNLPVLAHLAVSANPWPGPVAVWRSLDDGVSYQLHTIVQAPAITGDTLDDLPRGPTSRWDRVARTRVKLHGGALASASDLRVLSGANAAAVRRPDGAWEILQFANAVLTAERTYEISRLLRGELGSEASIADPLAAGAPFVVLDPYVVPVARGIDTIGRRMKLRMVAANRNHGDPSAVEIELRPDALAYQPLAPVHLRARREAGGVHFTWRARRRGLAGVTFAARPDIGEANEAYELDIMSGSVVVRTLNANTPSIFYSATNETADFGGPQTSLSVRLYQLSAVVGRGLPATATLTPLRVLMSTSANLALPFIEGGELLPDVTLNETLRLIDTLVQLAIVDRDLNAPPGSPAEGQRWIVKASPSPTGAWAGHGNHIAAWQDGGWVFCVPQAGWYAYAIDESALLAWSGTAWVNALAGLAVLQNLALLGVGTTADATNPFSAKLNNALWIAKTLAEGGDGHLRYKLSKESAAKTLSLLMQTNFSGRAEIGLTGDDDFHFKVSADGSTWVEAIKIDRTTGKLSFPISGGPRELLSANRTYYVRTDGSDANTGLANTSGGAFPTLGRAWDAVCGLDLNGTTATIQIADGSYAGGINATRMPNGPVVIQGNATTPANVLIGTTGADAFAFPVGLPYGVTIKDMKITTATSGNSISLTAAGLVRFQNIDFGACALDHVSALAPGARIQATGNYAISGNARFHWFAGVASANVAAQGRTITLSGTPAFTVFAFVSTLSSLLVDGNTFVGSATGTRYLAALGGLIYTNGAGATYLPDNAGGSTSKGGQYI